jgi:hypothetical protein
MIGLFSGTSVREFLIRCYDANLAGVGTKGCQQISAMDSDQFTAPVATQLRTRDLHFFGTNRFSVASLCCEYHIGGHIYLVGIQRASDHD